MEVDEDVITLGQVVDLVRKFALAPVIDIVDGALTCGDDVLDAAHHISAGFLLESRSNEKQQFVSLHQLTSFGLDGLGW